MKGIAYYAVVIVGLAIIILAAAAEWCEPEPEMESTLEVTMAPNSPGYEPQVTNVTIIDGQVTIYAWILWQDYPFTMWCVRGHQWLHFGSTFSQVDDNGPVPCDNEGRE